MKKIKPLRGAIVLKISPDMPWLMARGVIFILPVGEVVILHPKISFVHGGGVVELLSIPTRTMWRSCTIGVLLNDAIVGVDYSSRSSRGVYSLVLA